MKPDKKKSKTPVCTEYEMDLTDYVRGDMTFLTKEKQAKLFAHMKTCAKCREAFKDWKTVSAKLAADRHDAKPETQKRLAELKEQLKNTLLPPVPNETYSKHKIGYTAGEIWKFLGANGPTSLPDLHDKTKTDPYLAILSAGWLACEDKVKFDNTKPTSTVMLTEKEQEIYFNETGKLGSV